jgi:hypothetical protein
MIIYVCFVEEGHKCACKDKARMGGDKKLPDTHWGSKVI